MRDDHRVTAAALREYADALDKDRGHDRSSVTRLMRKAADELEWLTAARDALQEVGEGFVAAGQAAVARAVAAEAETARLREALRFEGVCEFCSGGGEDHRKWPAAVTACPVCGGDGLSEVAREALAGGAWVATDVAEAAEEQDVTP